MQRLSEGSGTSCKDVFVRKSDDHIKHQWTLCSAENQWTFMAQMVFVNPDWRSVYSDRHSLKRRLCCRMLVQLVTKNDQHVTLVC